VEKSGGFYFLALKAFLSFPLDFDDRLAKTFWMRSKSPKGIALSPQAAAAYARIKRELAGDKRFKHQASASKIIEFLVWHFEQTREHVRFDLFSPMTLSAGRPQLPEWARLAMSPSELAVRPADVRAEVARQCREHGVAIPDKITAERRSADPGLRPNGVGLRPEGVGYDGDGVGQRRHRSPQIHPASAEVDYSARTPYPKPDMPSDAPD
jgi:hypothetical protein